MTKYFWTLSDGTLTIGADQDRVLKATPKRYPDAIVGIQSISAPSPERAREWLDPQHDANFRVVR